MINALDLDNGETCQSILRVQVEAYRIEADLIDFPIPALFESARDLPKTAQHYYGFFEDKSLLGLIAASDEDQETLDICKLCIDPAHFRKGIARRLLVFLEQKALRNKKRRIIVSTGSGNSPAIQLYRKQSYKITGIEQIPEGPELTLFEKRLAIHLHG